MSFLTALSAIGTVTSFLGQQKAARAAEAVSEYNAKVAAEEAVLLQRAKTAQEENLRRRAERLLSTQRVATAASGIEMSGSPMQAMADTYFSLEKDVAMLQYASTIEQTAKQAEIDLTRLQGRAGASAQRINAYSSLLGGAVSTYELNRRITTGLA
jgi:hypothetical protein